MDSGRYIPPQARWDNNSALANFNAARDPEYRIGGGFGGRGFPEGNYPGESVFPREPFRRDIILEREGFPPPPPVMGLLPPARRTIVEEEYNIIRPGQRHEKVGYVDTIRDMDNFRDADHFRDFNSFRDIDNYHHADNLREANDLRDYGVHRRGGFPDRYEADNYEYDYRPRAPIDSSREGNHDPDNEYSRHTTGHNSDYERRRHSQKHRDKDGDWEKYRSRERDRSFDRDKHRDRSRSRSCSRSHSHSHSRSRSRSRSYDEWSRRSYSSQRSHSSGSQSPRRSRSPRRSYSPFRSRSPRSHSRSRREDSVDDAHHESSWRRNRDERRYYERARVAPSATLVVKGLSQKTVEDDLYEALTEWGPLRHVRVIKERSSGISRGFAFIDFPSVDAARKTMEGLREDGLVLDGRRVYFEYSSKPTGGVGGPQAVPAGSAPGVSKHGTSAVDWMCTVCGCVNFARRTFCFQCNEGRADDAPAADVHLSMTGPIGRKGSEVGPTHVLVVRGLDEHANEDMLHYEFSKYAAIKDLRLVRDKFTHVSRGFAFVHFHSVEEATKALEATNGTALEKNGQLLRVAYAKSIHGPGSSAASQTSSIAAAAIEAATFAQQYDSAGRAQKEHSENAGGTDSSKANGAPQSGYIWDEASGYYYDAASGFYYDPHRGLFYDGNHGVWYSYNQETQQYVPYVEPDSGAATDTEKVSESEKGLEDTVTKKTIEKPTQETSTVVPAETTDEEKKPSLAEAVQAAAIAAQAAAKKDKEKMKEKEKEIRLALKGSLLASKKKLLTLWKQRQNEGEIGTPMPGSERPLTTTTAPSRDQKHESFSQSAAAALGTVSNQSYAIIKKPEALKDGGAYGALGRVAGGNAVGENYRAESYVSMQQANSTVNTATRRVETAAIQSASLEVNPGATPFKTDASALGSYGPMAGAKRRFTEAPQPVYRDRAAERRSLYGSSSSHDEVVLEMDTKDKGVGTRGWGMDMPFPPGVGPKGSGSTTGSALGGPEVQAYEVITAETAIDERNVGNRMLRSMGWQEGSGLGKDGSGIVEPVQAHSTDVRAGLGSQAQHRKGDSRFETQPGDSYRVVIQKKALARFHEMI